MQSSRATAWLAGWLVAGRSRVTGSSLRCTRARDTVRVTRSGLVANRRSLAQAAGGVLQYQARVALGGGLVCRTGGVVYGQTTSSMDSEACEQRGVLRRCVAAQPSKCASEAARRSPEGRVTGGRPVQDRVAVGRPAQDRVAGGRPVHDRVAHGRTAGVGQGCWWTAGGDQGRPWMDGRCRSGSPVDGRWRPGSPMAGRPVQVRVAGGRPANDRVPPGRPVQVRVSLGRPIQTPVSRRRRHLRCSYSERNLR